VTGPVEPASRGVRLRLHVQPRASRNELTGLHGNALKLRIAAPAADGAANRELIRFLAERLGVPTRDLEIVSGLGSRRKTLLVLGVPAALVRSRLLLPDPGDPR
jgi:uncharacterized protein